jgi:surface antigen
MVGEFVLSLRPYLAYLKPVRAFRIPTVRTGAVVGALLWAVILFGGHWALQQQSVTSTKGVASARANNAIAASKQAPMQLASALPAGPTGLLLPPGTMAPIYTYRNSYARGQCTWYVAGRRPVPDRWGNANSWYSHAVRAGWKVGTVPAIAAIATTSAGWYGHVALVEAIEGNQVLISEMNYIGAYKLSHRWVPASSFRYIY